MQIIFVQTVCHVSLMHMGARMPAHAHTNSHMYTRCMCACVQQCMCAYVHVYVCVHVCACFAVALRFLKHGRAPWKDRITAELLKLDGGAVVDYLTHLASLVWESEIMLDDWLE